MHQPNTRILGRQLAVEDLAIVTGARGAGTEGALRPPTSASKPWLDTKPVLDYLGP